MNNSAQLVIYSNKKNNKSNLIVLPTLIFVLTIGLDILSNIKFNLFKNFLWENLSHHFYCFIVLLLEIVIFLIIVLFVLGFLFLLFDFFSNKPVVVLNSKGLSFRYYCFVYWDDILEIQPYYMGGGETLGIRVKNLDILFKKSKLSGKIGIFWSKIFGYHHINISNITFPNEEIISFASKYIKHKGIIHE